MIYVAFFVLGVFSGGFLSLFIFRAHRHVPLTGNLACAVCEVPKKPHDVLPIIGHLSLKKRCKHCKSAFTWQYPLIEIATGILFALGAYALISAGEFASFWPEFLRLASFILILVIIFVYDARYSYILDEFSIPAMILVVLLNLLVGTVTPLSMLFGVLVLGGFFAIQYIISSGEWIGDGDIRMGIIMGLMLGFHAGLFALLASYLIGAIVASLLLIGKQKDLHSHIPFGTFLSVGTFLGLLVGTEVVEWFILVLL